MATLATNSSPNTLIRTAGNYDVSIWSSTTPSVAFLQIRTPSRNSRDSWAACTLTLPVVRPRVCPDAACAVEALSGGLTYQWAPAGSLNDAIQRQRRSLRWKCPPRGLSVSATDSCGTDTARVELSRCSPTKRSAFGRYSSLPRAVRTDCGQPGGLKLSVGTPGSLPVILKHSGHVLLCSPDSLPRHYIVTIIDSFPMRASDIP